MIRGRYRVFKTRRYTIYYLLDDVELGDAERKMIKGNHEFLYFGNTVVIKPKQISQSR